MSIFDYFKHLNLSSDQQTALSRIDAFLHNTTQVFMLKGYAGSGKTTILKGLANYLHGAEKKFVLMAPTGRASKVIREKTGEGAYTIHKSIYDYDDIKEVKESGSFYYSYSIKSELDVDMKNKIFIVDEASMVSDALNENDFFCFGTNYLLSDLITYTKINDKDIQSKIIFVGDPCQLPPVKDNSSKAFDAIYLKEKFNLSSEEVEMKEVKRQGGESGILKVAAKIRKSITAGFFNNFSITHNEKDIVNLSYTSFLDTWEKTINNKIIIASKNKTCYNLNLQIRERKFGDGYLPIQKGDIVIMGNNNYSKGVFNGEFAVVNEVSSTVIERKISFNKNKNPITLTWRYIELVFPDSIESNNKIVIGHILDNFLWGDNQLKLEEKQALYVDFKQRHSDLKSKDREFKEAIRNDHFFNCLLIKYGYAVTCHKAQGGEWDQVFTVWDHDNTPGFNVFSDKQKKVGKTNENFYRWAYTAITRASKKLFILNPPFFTSYSNMVFVDEEVANSVDKLTGNQTQPEEIPLDSPLLEQLTQFALLNEPILLQDHFIKVRHVVQKKYMEVVGWQKMDYEIRYTFQRESNKAVFKTYINKQHEFKNPIIVIPHASLNNEFNKEIEELLRHLPNVFITRKTIETIASKKIFDVNLEEQFPFISNLLDDMLIFFINTNIKIVKVEHLQYKERYTFKRNNEVAVIDFEYTKDGFFGRILPVKNTTNSKLLTSNIKHALQLFKQENYAN